MARPETVRGTPGAGGSERVSDTARGSDVQLEHPWPQYVQVLFYRSGASPLAFSIPQPNREQTL